MRKCLIIRVSGDISVESYKSYIQKNAMLLGIEGTVQSDGDGIFLNACGQSEKLDQLIDMLYKGVEKTKLKDIEIEPLVSDKDFRSVFRIIG